VKLGGEGAVTPEEHRTSLAVVLARLALALLCVALIFFTFPAGYFLVGFPAVLLGASFWRPKVAVYGLAALVALFVISLRLNS
jgi:hypothetical protein